MLNLTQTLALELAPDIRVNAVSPGQVPTEAFTQVPGVDEAWRAELVADTPLGRPGTRRTSPPPSWYLVCGGERWMRASNLFVAGG